MKLFRNLLKVSFSVFLALGMLATAYPVLSAEKGSDEWDIYVAGYLFALDIDATSGVGTPLGDSEMDIDLGFSDLFDHMDSAFSGVLMARKGRLSLNVDISSVRLSIDQEITPAPVDADIDVEIGIDEIELFAGYKFSQQYPNLEVIAGARYINQDIDVKVNAGPIELDVNVGDDWIDPFVGLRYHGPIDNKWALLIRGDVGGFGVGSDFAWRFNAGVTYKLAQNWEAAFMYKILNIDYDNNKTSELDYYKWDGTESGLLLGVGYHF